jgi:hypothetical protein
LHLGIHQDTTTYYIVVSEQLWFANLKGKHMEPLLAISTAISSAKTAFDLAKGISSINTTLEMNQKTIELQSIILSLQQSLIEVQQAFVVIEKKLAEHNEWEDISKRYNLIEPAPGKYIYSLRNEYESKDNPNHWLCPNCYKDKKPSIMQTYKKDQYWHLSKCPSCNFNISIKLADEPPIQFLNSGLIV